jgi:probable phosphoglycerate mutase
MTEVYLIRHGATDAIGRSFTGRLPGVHLNGEGGRQATVLARYFAQIKLDVIFSSPSERARETANPIAASHSLTVCSNAAFAEIDVGKWSGESFEKLAADSAFQLFNSARSLSRPPSGEMMLEVQTRAVSELLRIAERHAGNVIAMVSHADVIRAVLAYFLGMPIDLSQRLEIALASISLVRLSPSHVQIIYVNQVIPA